jgi:uncharacterized coiled-coil protein SlyX
MGSLIDPEKIQREGLQEELRDVIAGVRKQLDHLVERFHAIPPETIQTEMRIEMLIDLLVPRHNVAGEDPEGIPTNLKRLDFELAYQRKLLSTLKDVEEQFAQQQAAMSKPKLEIVRGQIPGMK